MQTPQNRLRVLEKVGKRVHMYSNDLNVLIELVCFLVYTNQDRTWLERHL